MFCPTPARVLLAFRLGTKTAPCTAIGRPTQHYEDVMDNGEHDIGDEPTLGSLTYFQLEAIIPGCLHQPGGSINSPSPTAGGFTGTATLYLGAP